jgi:hypothetical protein
MPSASSVRPEGDGFEAREVHVGGEGASSAIREVTVGTLGRLMTAG